jgi:hypothetical protein
MGLVSFAPGRCNHHNAITPSITLTPAANWVSERHQMIPTATARSDSEPSLRNTQDVRSCHSMRDTLRVNIRTTPVHEQA